MMRQYDDTIQVCEHDPPALRERGELSYYAEVSAGQHDEQIRQIELLIDLAFGALGARHLAVRVCLTE